ncbi:hypothetical protein HPB48_012315 [Haemaphysalis longicornis]|uniref:Uncharacterized protein n=1 Tax=Haemaphysalis longicornis TaxID=44386 RepID=A0A9J6GXY4_HAELO|nr:hypothetical protein HPB48_012315 [Haemaphysalis longicornis]
MTPNLIVFCHRSVLHYINILDTVLTLIVPLLLITTMNAMISRSVYLYYHRHNRENGAKVFGEKFGNYTTSASRKRKRAIERSLFHS